MAEAVPLRLIPQPESGVHRTFQGPNLIVTFLPARPCCLKVLKPSKQYSMLQNMDVNSATKPSPNNLSYLHDVPGNAGTELVGVANQGPNHERESMPDTAYMIRIQRLDSPETWDRKKSIK